MVQELLTPDFAAELKMQLDEVRRLAKEEQKEKRSSGKRKRVTRAADRDVAYDVADLNKQVMYTWGDL